MFQRVNLCIFEQQTEVSPKEVLAGQTIVTSNDNGSLTTFGSYYGGDMKFAHNDYEEGPD